MELKDALTPEEIEESKKWTEIELRYLNAVINRRFKLWLEERRRKEAEEAQKEIVYEGALDIVKTGWSFRSGSKTK